MRWGPRSGAHRPHRRHRRRAGPAQVHRHQSRRVRGRAVRPPNSACVHVADVAPPRRFPSRPSFSRVRDTRWCVQPNRPWHFRWRKEARLHRVRADRRCTWTEERCSIRPPHWPSLTPWPTTRARRACARIARRHQPSLLFLDEPTSGLDSFTAYNVMETLRKVRRTRAFIHAAQPADNLTARGRAARGTRPPPASSRYPRRAAR